MRVKNITEGKVFGIGEVNVLPDETVTVPQGYESSPVIEILRKANMLEKIQDEVVKKNTSDDKAKAEEIAKADAEKKAKAEADADALRLARLEAVKNGLNNEELGQLANELGINPADCKDQADVLKKVKAALKK